MYQLKMKFNYISLRGRICIQEVPNKSALLLDIIAESS